MKNSIFLLFLLGTINITTGQTTEIGRSKYPEPVTFTNHEEHLNMMEQLGIKVLRPGPSGNDADPNHANHDESLADVCPELPELLITKSGKKVTTAEMWWKERRPELVKDLESEMYGNLPPNIPNVTWSVKITDREFVGRIPVIAKQVIGHVDNSEYPLIDVDINMIMVLPTNVDGPVPVLMMYGRPSFPAPAQPSRASMEALNSSFKDMMVKSNPEMKAIFDQYPAYSPVTRLPRRNRFAPPPEGDLPSIEQLLAAGWGYVTLEPASIQADNGAGLTRGIIGLVNKGQPRKPEEWGALRAWAWGAARAIDYLETEEQVDAKKIGIEGVSRYGKAAIVTLAFEERFAVGLIGSSGKGGVTISRRNFGQAVESLAGGENYWMAGNYKKYGAEESIFGRMTGCDLPVDAHSLLALCAPRLNFISYGVPEKGDAHWLDQKGSYMATVAAGAVYKLLGAKDLGVSNDYMKEVMPPVNKDMLEGHLAWRQHDGGHTDWPNMKHFIPWANKFLNIETKQ